MTPNLKVLGAGLIGLGTAFAGLILAQMWFEPFETRIFVRCLVTLALSGGYGLYIGMIWDDLDKSRYRRMLISLAVFGFVALVLILGQMWFEFLAWEVFGKVLISVIVVSGLISFVMAVRDDFFDGKRLRDENFLD